MLLLALSDIWLSIYLLLYSRYAQMLSNKEWIKRLLSPFFLQQVIWGDFYGPIQNSATLAPYAPKYGNSPPFLALVSWLFAKLQERGVGWAIIYCFLWLCFSFFLFYFIRQSAADHNVKKVVA